MPVVTCPAAPSSSERARSAPRGGRGVPLAGPARLHLVDVSGSTRRTPMPRGAASSPSAGPSLSAVSRTGPPVMTKVDADPVTGRFDGDRVRRSVEESLGRLGVDRLPLLHLHDPHAVTLAEALAPDGAVPALVRLRDEGVVDAIGVASGPPELAHAYVRTGALRRRAHAQRPHPRRPHRRAGARGGAVTGNGDHQRRPLRRRTPRRLASPSGTVRIPPGRPGPPGAGRPHSRRGAVTARSPWPPPLSRSPDDIPWST